MNPSEPVAAAREQGAGLSGEETQENESESMKDGEDNRVEPYVDFSDFNRQLKECGEDYVYGWDNLDKTEAAT